MTYPKAVMVFQYVGSVSVDASAKKKLLEVRGKGFIRQLGVYYNGNDTTGTDASILTLRIDDRLVIQGALADIHLAYSGASSAFGSNSPVVTASWSVTAKAFALAFHDLGVFKEHLELWLNNGDTTNAADCAAGVAYEAEAD